MTSIIEPAKETVIVAMSGGVDSSVTAGLLQRDGHKVIGATLLFRPCDDDDAVSWCCARGAQEAARAAAGELSIPHYVVECAAEFERDVLRPAWEEYDRGRTPSPCISCNKQIKFELLIELADKIGADSVATGHYARVERDEESGRALLRCGKDASKDQSYFLYSLSQEQLVRARFPLGALEKKEVRRLAAEMELPNAERPESQDACFTFGKDGFAEGLRQRFAASARSGQVIDFQGNILGDHKGIHRFTVGQRKGLGIALGHRAYVAQINADSSRVVLSADDPDLTSNQLTASDVSWTSGVCPPLPVRVRAKIRYRHKAADAVVEPLEEGRVAVKFDTPQRAITPGQATVFYDGDRVLGGGWID